MSYKVSKENGEAILKIIRRCDGITRDDLMERSGLDADAFRLAMVYVSPYVLRLSGEYTINTRFDDADKSKRVPARTMPISN
jgi:Ser/Thr protein kinase RdoA (MazF antagonist)